MQFCAQLKYSADALIASFRQGLTWLDMPTFSCQIFGWRYNFFNFRLYKPIPFNKEQHEHFL